MKPEVELLKNRAEEAKWLYKRNVITRAEAKAEIEPYIEAVNAKSKKLAKKYSQKHKPVTITGYLR